jgi:cellulose synthase/poly-beta-1,6-N-acetylglucosamine synthase-like glycosyltransferase
MIYWTGIIFFVLMTVCIVYLLSMSLYNLALVRQYRRLRGADPQPSAVFADINLPRVTIQLPTYNEGPLAREILLYAAEIDYPRNLLEIQFLDDSDDNETTKIAQATISELRERGFDVRYFHRDTRTGYKAGALKLGTEAATGDFYAIFDADFVIPRDFLRRTIHFFTEPSVGIVQARWDYVNRDSWLFTQLQANKLDSHQMFEQTARARSGLPVIFHGTAGIWRASALEAAGGWNCMSEVEDVELTIRAAMKGWRTIYLDHLRVMSELPESVNGFVRQQMRWKRGWTRIVLHYTKMIMSGPVSWRDRIDLLQRVHLSWGPVAGLAMTLGVLPFFMMAERLNLTILATALYLSGLGLSLVTRELESRTLNEDTVSRAPLLVPSLVRHVPFNYLIMGLGMFWPLTQATFEGFRPGQVWEVTPKLTSTRQSSGHFPAPTRMPGYVIGTLVLALIALLLTAQVRQQIEISG